MPRIGPYTLHAIETGRFRLDGGSMFGVVPKVLWERRVSADSRNRIQLHTRCLLLQGDGRLILVDTGMGHKESDWFVDAFAVDFSEYSLEKSLQNIGFAPEDVTDVILTHLHFDHGGGSTKRVRDSVIPTFCNATYYVQKAQWETAMVPNVREAASFLKNNFVPLMESGQLVLTDGSQPLFPGIDLIRVNGHTEAQQLVKVTGDAGVLVYVADLFPLTHHIRASWVMAYDVQPLVTLAEKDAFLKEAFENNYHLFFEHDPEAVIANVSQGAKGFAARDIRPLEELM